MSDSLMREREEVTDSLMREREKERAGVLGGKEAR